MTRDEIVDRMDAMSAELRTLRGEVSLVSDHTFEIDSLREHVKGLEADKAEMRNIIRLLYEAGSAYYDCAKAADTSSPKLSLQYERGNAVARAADSAIKEYKREHGGEL